MGSGVFGHQRSGQAQAAGELLRGLGTALGGQGEQFKPMERSSNIQIRGSLIHDALLKYSSLVSRMCYRLLVACEKKKTASRGGVVGRGARPGVPRNSSIGGRCYAAATFRPLAPSRGCGGIALGGV